MTDYISRQAAIEALAGWKISPIVLYPVPSADVRENVRGKWKDVVLEQYEGWNVLACECSACGQRALNGSRFCPNCGADMRGEL